jgi:hypothetical protein
MTAVAIDVPAIHLLAWDNRLFRQELGASHEGLIAEIKAALKDFLDL